MKQYETKCDKDCALFVHAQVDVHVARVVVHAVVGLMLVLSARVIVVVFIVEFPWPVFCIRRFSFYTPVVSVDSKLRWLLPNTTVTFAPDKI